MFKFEPLGIPKAERVDSASGRVYITPDGNRYPSVTGITSLAGQMFGKPDYLAEWRAEVGDEEAARISKRASSQGTRFHEAIESFLFGNEPTFSLTEINVRDLFNSVKPIIQKSVGTIKEVEVPLWSDKFRLAGTCDLIAEWDEELSIIDWKTSSRFKSPEEIVGYWMQTAIYAFCLYERTKLAVNNLVICIASGDGPQVLKSDAKPYLRRISELRRLYAKTNHEKDYLDYIGAGNYDS